MGADAMLNPVIEDDDEWLWEHRFSGRSKEDLLTEKRMRVDLPYGMWRCADGREVLFNRYYRAIWQRAPGQGVMLADRDEKVPWIEECHFYDADEPWRRNKVGRLMAVKLDTLFHDFRKGRPIASHFVVHVSPSRRRHKPAAEFEP
jgi:hypothetical protein